MAGRTIHIVEGVKMNTARWSLKMELEVFGKIDVCHMGDRFNQKEHPAWVKFNTREGAQKAMDAMDTGRVLCNGEPIRGEWRKEVAAPAPVGDILDAPELNLTSRDLFGGMRDRVARRRSRSRSRRSRGRGSVPALENGSVPLIAVEDGPDPEKNQHGSCPLGHGIVPVVSIDDENVTKCDICDCQQASDVEILRCKTCAYHLCRQCVDLNVLA